MRRRRWKGIKPGEEGGAGLVEGQSDMGFPLISQRLHTPSGKQDAGNRTDITPCTLRRRKEREREGRREGETERGGGGGGGRLDSQGHLNKHKPDAEHAEHVCEHETGVCG